MKPAALAFFPPRNGCNERGDENSKLIGDPRNPSATAFKGKFARSRRSIFRVILSMGVIIPQEYQFSQRPPHRISIWNLNPHIP